MKEYMLLIRNVGDGKAAFTPEIHHEFVKKCELYIGELKKEDRLIAAQPLIREGTIIRKNGDAWQEHEVNGAGEIQVGYYHIRARDLQEAMEIARKNPEFEYVPHASVEVRPVKMKEFSTGFVYPKS